MSLLNTDLLSVERDRLAIFDRELQAANAQFNLVAPSTIPDRTVRHYEDSFQLFSLVPSETRSLLDIGSGGGFPGLLLALLAQSRMPDLTVTLCESIGKKASFLERVSKEMGLTNVSVRQARVEDLQDEYDVVTARAVANLSKLLGWLSPIINPTGTAILPKGRNAETELQEATKQWRMHVDRVRSKTDPDATIFVLRQIEPRQ